MIKFFKHSETDDTDAENEIDEGTDDFIDNSEQPDDEQFVYNLDYDDECQALLRLAERYSNNDTNQ